MSGAVRSLRPALAITRKELITIASYRASMIIQIMEIWYFAISFYFIDRFVGDVAFLDDLDGGYFEFVLIGSIVTSFSRVGISAFSELISEEQSDGTLEVMLASPAPLSSLLLGSFVVPVLFLLVETIALVGVGLGLFGSGIPVVGLLKAVPILVLNALAFVPVGILGASFMLLAKQGDPFAAVANRVAILLSGALYPVAVLPGWMQAIGQFIPATHTVEAVRALAQGQAGFGDVIDEALIVAAFLVIVMPITLIVFRRAIDTARRTGILGTY